MRLPHVLASLAATLYCAGWAQPVAVGVKGGAPFTAAVEGSFGNRPEAPRYAVGPVIEAALPRSFAVEAGALYRRTGYSTFEIGFDRASTTRVRANVWEFPVLAKYYLRGGRSSPRPYAAAGYAIRRVSGLEAAYNSIPFETTRFFLRDNPTHGLAAAGGLRFRLGRLWAAPEVRYVRWNGRPFDQQGPRGFFIQSLRNQAEILVGIGF